MRFSANLVECKGLIKEDFVVDAVYKLHNFDSAVVLSVAMIGQRAKLQLAEVPLETLFKHFF